MQARYWRKTSPGFRAAICSPSPVAASSFSSAARNSAGTGDGPLGDAERPDQIDQPAPVAPKRREPVLQQGQPGDRRW